MMPETWEDLKIAFNVDELYQAVTKTAKDYAYDDTLWDIIEDRTESLVGWSLVETTDQVNGYLAIFRVEHLPTELERQLVRNLLDGTHAR